ncbi:MAG TPA: PIN domain-containing protein [Anaerolineales bacterium]|nr:PIN domain-containing protein [Anaerolineales bacterium]
MPDYFFDTSVLIAYFRNEDTRSEVLLEEVLNGKATAAISAITVAEIWSAKNIDAETRRLQQAVVQLMEAVPVDASVAKRGGAIRRTHGLKLPDALVVACCQVSGGKFFSKDPHFRRVLDQHEITGEVYG